MPLIPSSALLSHKSIPSPITTTLPNLSKEEVAALPYPPNVFPGARDVQTTFGRMHVYEWGKEDGRKVVLIHGDATPAPLFKWLADSLIQRGCRLIVFDLWGHGYSDTPLVPHTASLYSLQILFAASSSPLPWTVEGFSIIGFSLGGAITMDFVMSFPHLVRSVALLAPAGLLGSLPEEYERLKENGMSEEETRRRVGEAQGIEPDKAAPVHRGDDVDAGTIVRWQYDNHEGHVASFANTVQLELPQNQRETWVKACKVLRAKREISRRTERLLVVCGSDDGVVIADTLGRDLDSMMEQDEFVLETVTGGHASLVGAEASGNVAQLLAREWAL